LGKRYNLRGSRNGDSEALALAAFHCIAVGDKNNSGWANKICPIFIHLPEYDQ